MTKIRQYGERGSENRKDALSGKRTKPRFCNFRDNTPILALFRHSRLRGNPKTKSLNWLQSMRRKAAIGVYLRFLIVFRDGFPPTRE
jgi:hypothetical protein